MKIDLAALENDPAEFQETLELSAEKRKPKRHKITVPAPEYDIEG